MLEKNIKWIMIVIGAITCTMVFTAISPQQGLMNTFGVSLDGAVAEVVTRSWGMLITITGGLLIYGAFNPVHRKLVMVAACISKTWFVALNLTIGEATLNASMPAVIFDSVAVVVFMIYIVTSKSASS